MIVWILQTGEPLHIDGSLVRPMRAINLAQELASRGHKVVIWSADFYHQEKKHRFGFYKKIKISKFIEIKLIPSPGYKKNISFGRLYDHFVLARNLKKILSFEKKIPDVAFIGYPPIETAYVMVQWLKIFNIPTILDIKDQWPVIFIDALPNILRPLAFVFLYPYVYFGRKVLRESSALSSITPPFLNWALKFSGRNKKYLDLVAPLTNSSETLSKSDLIRAKNWWNSLGVKDDNLKKFIFIGSHSRAFDFDPVYEAALFHKDCQFIICGNGEYYLHLRQKFLGLKNVLFPGWIDRSKVKSLASLSTAALAPYKNTEDFQMSIPNKIIDYLSLGLPILTPLLGQVSDLIAKKSVGLCYGEIYEVKLTDLITQLKNKPALVFKLSKNAKKVHLSLYDFKCVYGNLVKNLELLSRLK